jgi:cysteine-S-conjugate beta-lyase
MPNFPQTYNYDVVVDRRGTDSEKWDKYRGRDVISLWVADMDFPSARPIHEALLKRVDHGIYGYTHPSESLISAVADHLQHHFRYKINPQWLVWLPGVATGLTLVCRSVGNPGDQVLVNSPIYPPFLRIPSYAQREVLDVPLIEENGHWQIDWEMMEKRITPRTKLYLFCHPHNPVGRVFTFEELQKVAEFALRHQLVVCSDEVHNGLVFDQRPHHLYAALGKEVEDSTITFMSASKTYNVPGLNCAYAIIPNEKLRLDFMQARRGVVGEINVFGLLALEAAYRHAESWRQELLTYLQVNRDFLIQYVQKELSPLRIFPVEGTYLAWMDGRALNVSNPADFFEAAGVGLMDGEYFGLAQYLRLNFACPRRVLAEGLHRMKKALQNLQ